MIVQHPWRTLLNHRSLLAEIFSMLCFMPMLTTAVEDYGDLEFGNPEHSEPMARLMYGNKVLKQIIIDTLPQLVYKGAVEV